jgi:hypothetical protein
LEAFEFVVGVIEEAFEGHLEVREAKEGVVAGGIRDKGANDELVGGEYGFVVP